MLQQACNCLLRTSCLSEVALTYRSAPPGMLVGHWQAASFDEDVPLRCRELMKVKDKHLVCRCLKHAPSKHLCLWNAV